MGSSSWTSSCYTKTLSTRGFATSDSVTYSDTSQVFTSVQMPETLNPYKVVRECCDSDEHPNTIPIMLCLDVTGSMNAASKACIAKLNDVMVNLYKDFTDVEIAIAGIGDFAYDSAPFQLSQFESDERIVDNLFNLYIENGGGGNSFESYTAAWYAGVHHTRLDCWNRGQRGILITIGDEELNPYLPKSKINKVFGDTVQADVNTNELYEQVCEKYDVYHIVITNNSCFKAHQKGIEETWGQLLGQHLIYAKHEDLAEVIHSIVADAQTNSNTGGISW